MKSLRHLHQKCYQAAHLCLPDCQHWCICHWWPGMSGSSWFCLGGKPGRSSQLKMPQLQSCLHCLPAATIQSSLKIKASHTDMFCNWKIVACCYFKAHPRAFFETLVMCKNTWSHFKECHTGTNYFAIDMIQAPGVRIIQVFTSSCSLWTCIQHAKNMWKDLSLLIYYHISQIYFTVLTCTCMLKIESIYKSILKLPP